MHERIGGDAEGITGGRVLTLARPIVLVLLMAVLGFAAHLAAESVARPEAIRTNILDGFSQRLVGDGSIATDLLGTRQTHFSECIAFSILANSQVEGGFSRIIRMESNYWTPPQTICSTFLEAALDPARKQWFSYARYWHGYLILHKPILSYLDYRSFLKIINALFVIVLVVFALVISTRFGLLPVLALLTVFLLLSPGLWSWFNPTVAISFSTLLLGCTYFSRFGPEQGMRDAVGAATVAGVAFNFFDFLYFPALLAAMICWLATIHQVRSRSTPIDWRPLVLALISIAAYLGMWMLKWWISFTWSFLEPVQLPNTGDFSRWILGGGDTYVPFAATTIVVERVFRTPLTWTVAWIVAAGVLVFAIRFRASFLQYICRTSIPPAVLAFLILEGMARHSVAHPFADWVIAWLVAMLSFNCVRYFGLSPREPAALGIAPVRSRAGGLG
jgi:hypothetical protein